MAALSWDVRDGIAVVTLDKQDAPVNVISQSVKDEVYAMLTALERAGIQWKDLGLIEIHEAFASQVLSNLQGFAAKGWEINEDIINVMGGSIAIGHPFGATGGRIVITLSNEMRRRDVQFGLISVCAQGGMGFAMVLERR